MSERTRRPKFWPFFLQGIVMMLLGSAIEIPVGETWIVHRLETANLDALFAAKQTEVSKRIFVIAITDEDYADPGLFKDTSPLNPGTLQQVLSAVVACHPAAVGVDFDTSGWTAQPFDSKGVPMVWAREEMGEGSKAHLGNVLGRSGPEDICWGVPAYVPDQDGFVREFRPSLNGGSGQTYPSLATNLVEVYSHGLGACKKAVRAPASEKAGEEMMINFVPKGGFNSLSAGALIKLATSEKWLSTNPLRDKLVLVGGTYHAARDRYPTPVGYMDGVEILANTAQSELPGGALTHGPWWVLPAKYLLAILLLALSYVIPRAWGLPFDLVTGPIFAVVLSWAAFRSGAAFLSFMPTFVGIFVHEVIEQVKERRKLMKENKELEHRVRELEAGSGVAAAKPTV